MHRVVMMVKMGEDGLHLFTSVHNGETECKRQRCSSPHEVRAPVELIYFRSGVSTGALTSCGLLQWANELRSYCADNPRIDAAE
jgi:hypothetical protein